MIIKVGYELVYECPKPTPMLLTLNIHETRSRDLLSADNIVTHPSVPITAYRDVFGNCCSRIVAPEGTIRISANALVKDRGIPQAPATDARQHTVEELPPETLIFLLGSRYCETDRFTKLAWKLFEHTPPGWGRVQAICDFVHRHIRFGYEYARPTKSAAEVYREARGVCRDYAHLAITLCRCMNIPARYCTGYLGDIDVPAVNLPMDFSAWFEAYLDGRWHIFDPRHNTPRTGYVLVAQGRDATDVPISTTFGPNELKAFTVWADVVD